MEVIAQAVPFGSATRTRVLILLKLLGSSYARELARLQETSVSVVQKALISLERDGLVAAQTLGRLRLYRINPRYFALTELDAYVQKLSDAAPQLERAAATIRRRPRRTGKIITPIRLPLKRPRKAR